TPLAVNFDVDGQNAFGCDQKPCDMRGRCWLGCDHQAKNTLDLNYLARMERTPMPPDKAPDVRTLAEVEYIEKRDGLFYVFYQDLLNRNAIVGPSHIKTKTSPSVVAPYVFLCAGSLNTTELLFRNRGLSGHRPKTRRETTPLGSHYFPNADSLATVFDCE